MAEDKEALFPNERVISFGQVILVKQGNDKKPPEKFIVVDPEEEHGFIHVAKILEGENNEERLGAMGSAKPEDIREILDTKWSLEKIEDGIRKYFKKEVLPKGTHEFLKTASEKPSGKI